MTENNLEEEVVIKIDKRSLFRRLAIIVVFSIAVFLIISMAGSYYLEDYFKHHKYVTVVDQLNQLSKDNEKKNEPLKYEK